MIDSAIYQNILLVLLIGSFFSFILCVLCVGACTDRGCSWCSESTDTTAQRLRRRRLHSTELFQHTCIQVPNMLAQIAQMHVPDHRSIQPIRKAEDADSRRQSQIPAVFIEAVSEDAPLNSSTAHPLTSCRRKPSCNANQIFK